MRHKKYFLTRFNDKQKYTLSRFTAAEQFGGQNIGPIESYEKAKERQKELNQQIEQDRKQKPGEIPA